MLQQYGIQSLCFINSWVKPGKKRDYPLFYIEETAQDFAKALATYHFYLADMIGYAAKYRYH